MREGWRVEEDVVRAVPEPEWTKTWHPVSHSAVLDSLSLAVKETGMEIVSKNYTLAHNETRLFGSWVLDKEDNGMRWMVGFRNSLDKQFGVGVCAGNHVIACSNMQFSGDDFIEFRRHTGTLTWEELLELAKRSMIGLIGKMAELAAWNKRLKERIMLNKDSFKILTFDAMKAGVFPITKFHEFLECYEMEKKENPETADTLYQFNGSVTRLLRDQSLFSINHRTTKLKNLLNGAMN